jgi:hypothetical protein
MPNHEEHCRHSEKTYGFRGDDIHRWIDAPSRFLGGSHRSERHDPKDVEMAIQVFGSKYGNEIVREIFNDHLVLDAEERNRSTMANGTKRPEYDEPSDPIPEDTSYSPSYKEIHWGSGNIILDLVLGSMVAIVFVYVFNIAFGNPIGVWWSQNWLNVIGVAAAIIFGIIAIYLLKDKNRIAKTLWNLIY